MACANKEVAFAVIDNLYFVQLSLPERGFGTELDVMVQFFLRHGEELRIGCLRSEGQDCILFCFRDADNAAMFARQFGGEVFEAPEDEDLFLP